MNKKVLGIILGVLLVSIVIVGAMLTVSKPQEDNTSLVKIETEKDLKKAIEKVHKNTTSELPDLETMTISVNDEYQFSNYTGLSSNKDIESLVVSIPTINAQPYEAAIIKVKAGADIEKIKQEILDNIDMNMWICVSADTLYVTNYKDVIFLVMSEKDWAKSVLESFKSYVGEKKIGKVLEKTQDFEDIGLPPEIICD